MDNKAYKAICTDAGISSNLVNGQCYWIRFSGPLYVYATRLHILSDTAHFGMYQAWRFKILEDESDHILDGKKVSEPINFEQMTLF